MRKRSTTSVRVTAELEALIREQARQKKTTLTDAQRRLVKNYQKKKYKK